MSDAPQLTAPQMRALRVLAEDDRGKAAREVALALWPNSPGWQRVSRRRSTPAGGALGATMPMKAAQLLWKLHRLGLAREEAYRWHITERGRTLVVDS